MDATYHWQSPPGCWRFLDFFENFPMTLAPPVHESLKFFFDKQVRACEKGNESYKGNPSSALLKFRPLIYCKSTIWSRAALTYLSTFSTFSVFQLLCFFILCFFHALLLLVVLLLYYVLRCSFKLSYDPNRLLLYIFVWRLSCADFSPGNKSTLKTKRLGYELCRENSHTCRVRRAWNFLQS